ncbi:MAG: pyrimidine reductase, partial [Nocardioidaceae bacterium]|nr:pyrimidine reductase [Nocardioidaceae bacterium]
AVADEDDFDAAYINHVPKYVVSSALTDPTWADTTVVGSADDVRRLKASTERDISMFGSATTVRWLLGEGLLDELVLLVHPVAVGHGARLFEDTSTRLDLIGSEAIDKGIVVSRYRPVAS